MTIFEQIDHECTIPREQVPPRISDESLKYKLKRLWFSLVQVSPVHSLTIRFFPTESQLRQERRRHYESGYFFTIHPLSKLSVLREAYLGLFYIVVIFYRTLEFAFLRRKFMHTPEYAIYLHTVNVIDVLTWLNLICMCFEGVIVKNTKLILLNPHDIFRYRLRSFFFWCEMLSSVPKIMICPRRYSCVTPFWLFLNILRLFAIFLFYQPVHLLRRTLAFLKIESRTVSLYVCVIYMMAFLTHLMACSEYGMARYRYILIGIPDNRSWIVHNNLINQHLRTQYFCSFFIATAQTFGVHVDRFDDHVNWAESVLSVINYVIGKLMLLSMWMVNISVLLAQDFHSGKYQEVISQLKTWMDNKELPNNLRKRLLYYYNFYYRRSVFSKKEIERTMPRELLKKLRVNLHKTLRESKGGILSQVSDHVLQKLGEHTVTEYFSANDEIIHSGIKPHSMYLLAYGSVAVYSRSGNEAYHLHDGSYFGELSMMLPDQNASGSVIALEASKVYRIDKKYFEWYILSKKEIYDSFLEEAVGRFEKIKKIENKYRKMMIDRKEKLGKH